MGRRYLYGPYFVVVKKEKGTGKTRTLHRILLLPIGSLTHSHRNVFLHNSVPPPRNPMPNDAVKKETTTDQLTPLSEDDESLDAESIQFEGARCSSVVRAFAHGAMDHRIDPSSGGPVSYFSFHPVLHGWCIKGRGMCYPVCVIVHYNKITLAVNRKE